MVEAIRINKASDTPIYIQLADELKRLLAEGSLDPGMKLPSVRKLADGLMVNPATVVSAYRILSREGLVESRAGSGIFVSANGMAGSASAGAGGDDPYWRITLGDADAPDKGTYPSGSGIIDFSGNAPSRELFPVAEFRSLIDEVIERDGGLAFEYQEPSGYEPLREALATLLVDGPPVDPDDLHLVSGAQQGIDLAVRALVRPGDVVAMENPAYRGATEVFRAAGARIERVPMTPGGLDLDALAGVAARARLKVVYVNPCFQNPTTQSYSDDVKRGLAELAERHGFIVLEDDLLSDLAYDRPTPLASVRSRDEAGRTVYIKSFSKILMPGLRAAFMAAPPALRARLDALKRTADISSNGLVQRALELFVRRGMVAPHVERVKRHYAGIYALFAAAMMTLRDVGCAFDEPRGGLNLWVRLPEGIRAIDLHAEARVRGCLVVPEAAFDPEGVDGHIRIGFASASAEDAVRGAGLIRESVNVLQGIGAGARRGAARVII
ncbi:MAG: PLP-dependent aminotransferase family protein [Spirochaetes bacterium]|nr:PLP-dependent aminotransferase family protein [Spirochaetota bacterium]